MKKRVLLLILILAVIAVAVLAVLFWPQGQSEMDTPRTPSESEVPPPAVNLPEKSFESAKSIMEKIVQDWDAVRTLRARVETYVKLEVPGEKVVRGRGTYETMKSEGRDLYRAELTQQNPASEGQASTTRVLKVFDGDTIYQQTTKESSDGNVPSGETAVVRAEEEDGDFSSFLSPGGIGMYPLGEFVSFGILTRLEDEILDGRAAYVLERSLMVSVDNEDPRVINRITCSFDQVTGALLRVDHYKGQDDLFAYTALHDIEINPEIDPERFTYTPPIGATVQEFGDTTDDDPDRVKDRSIDLLPAGQIDQTKRDPHMRDRRRRR